MLNGRAVYEQEKQKKEWRLEVVDSIADGDNVIQSIQKSRLIDIHPLKELKNQIVVLTCVRGVLYRLLRDKTNWFVMGYSISKVVYLTQLIKYVGVIVLNSRRADWFGGKYMQQCLASGKILWLSEQISPKTKVHLC